MTPSRSCSLAVVLLTAAAIMLAGCANNPNSRAEIGGGAGALLGGLIGSQIGHHGLRNGAIGAALGGLAGGGVGHYMDQQQQQLDQKLKGERARKELNVEQLPGHALKIGIANNATFATNKSTLTPHAQRVFSKIANVLRSYNKTAVHVVGFASSTGTKQYNLKLSRQRALSVAHFLINHGVNKRRVLTWARGESQPVASNKTAAGRAKNRRVAIVIKPIIKGHEKQAFSAPPPLGNRRSTGAASASSANAVHS